MTHAAATAVENRVFERFSARFPVKFLYARGGYGEDVFLRDASARGLRLTSRQRLFLNDSLAVQVLLPDGKPPLILNGRVVWIKTKAQDLWECGLEFHTITFMNLHRLFRLIFPES